MLGSGKAHAYLYDRGGEQQIGTFDRIVEVKWGRVLDDISEASVTALTPDVDDWHGEIRSWRHELVIYRDDERVWEGPVYRPIFGRGFVQVLARDVFHWTARRRHRGRFTDPVNAVGEVEQAVRDAMRFDDPNITPWIEARYDGSPLVSTAVNAADGSYWDAIGDVLDQGVHVTTVGRRIVAWPAYEALSRTVALTSDDLSADVTVVEDGLALSTRDTRTGGTTYGASSPEPEVVNYATNPTFDNGTVGWEAGRFFSLSRVSTKWGQGPYVGRVVARPPSKPSKSASRKTKDAYNARLQAYEQADVVLPAKAQAIGVHEGEDLSATLDARSVGLAGRVGLRLVGIDADGVVSDRAFASGPPIVLSQTTSMLFVEGTVPADVVRAFVEVYVDTNYIKPVYNADGTEKTSDQLTDEQRKPVRWRSGDGLEVDRFGWWRGRIEDWFSGSVPADATFTYSWLGGPDASPSVRLARRPIPDDYYGLVETIGRANGATTRLTLEPIAEDVVRDNSPAPLAIDVPQNAPLKPTSPIGIDELVAGAIIPVRASAGSRSIVAQCVLDSVDVTYTPKDGEQVKVTLLSGETAEVPADPLPPSANGPTPDDVAAMLAANTAARGLVPDAFEAAVVGRFVLATGRYVDRGYLDIDHTRADPVRLNRPSVGHGFIGKTARKSEVEAMKAANKKAAKIPGEAQFEDAVVGWFVMATLRFIDDTCYDVNYDRTSPVRLTRGTAVHS